MNIKFLKTDSRNQDFISLVVLLDADLNQRYGELQKQYTTYNKLDYINDVVIVFNNDIPIACGAFKKYNMDSVELKRIFVKKEFRRQGFSKLVINELELMAINNGYKYAVLETGIKQHEAINLYSSLGYTKTQNFEPYIGNENSICMKKNL